MWIKTSVEWNAGILFSTDIYLLFILYFALRDCMLVKEEAFAESREEFFHQSVFWDFIEKLRLQQT